VDSRNEVITVDRMAEIKYILTYENKKKFEAGYFEAF